MRPTIATLLYIEQAMPSVLNVGNNNEIDYIFIVK